MKCFIEDEVGALEAGIEVAIRPLDAGVAGGQRAAGRGSKLLCGPFDRRQFARDKGVALAPRVRAARTETRQRIDDERQRLEIQHDLLDRLRRRRFVHGGDGKDRLAPVERFVRQRRFGRQRARAGFFRRRRQVVGRQHRLDTGHGERLARLDPPHAAVRHRAQQQLAEQHAVRAEILRVLRPARDFGDQIRRRVVVTEQLVVRHPSLDSTRDRPEPSRRPTRTAVRHQYCRACATCLVLPGRSAYHACAGSSVRMARWGETRDEVANIRKLIDLPTERQHRIDL